jgi:dihydrolipoamide dehydrogenase
MYDLIVIGAGPGGYEAAAHAGRMGKKVALFDRKYIGGTCLNVGCIPTKTLLKSAHVFTECREAGKYGVTASSAKFSMKKVQERKKKVINSLTKGVEGMLKRSRVEIIRAEAKLTAKDTVKAKGKKYQAVNILIATGSRPAVPPVKGMDSKGVLDSTSALELTRKPDSIVIIGGGVIGLEFACFFSETGTRVTVVEMLPQIGVGLDADIMKSLKSDMEKKGVIFHLSSTVTEVKGKSVLFTDAKKKKHNVKGTFVMNATGRSPVMDGLGLEEAGVDFTRAGIITSDEGKTNVPGIWACGDVTGRCLLAHAATREGIVAVNNMFGRKDLMRYSAVPGVIYTHPEVACVGKTEAQLKEEGIAYRVSIMPMAIAGRYMVENEGVGGKVKVLVGEAHGEVLGVHMIGQGCSELIFGAAMMMETEMRVDDVKDIIFPHPTVSEALKETVAHA